MSTNIVSDKPDYNGITGSFNKNNTLFTAAVENEYDNALSTTATLQISGVLDSPIKTLIKVGTVTLTSQEEE